MFENFKRRWELIISKIENVAIDDLGVELIQLNFRCNRDFLVASMKEKTPIESLTNLKCLELNLKQLFRLLILDLD